MTQGKWIITSLGCDASPGRAGTQAGDLETWRVAAVAIVLVKKQGVDAGHQRQAWEGCARPWQLPPVSVVWLTCGLCGGHVWLILKEAASLRSHYTETRWVLSWHVRRKMTDGAEATFPSPMQLEFLHWPLSLAWRTRPCGQAAAQGATWLESWWQLRRFSIASAFQPFIVSELITSCVKLL